MLLPTCRAGDTTVVEEENVSAFQTIKCLRNLNASITLINIQGNNRSHAEEDWLFILVSLGSDNYKLVHLFIS